MIYRKQKRCNMTESGAADVLHTAQENMICYKSMKEMEKESAPHDFSRCHTGYPVSPAFVKGLRKPELLIGGESPPISQPRRKDFTALR